MSVTKGYLVVRATGDMRVTKQRVALRIDEVAFPLTVTIPDTWGRVQPTTIDVALPEPPEALVTVGNSELDEVAAP
jgi:hypothetical protein